MTEQELQEIKERLKAINGEDWFVYNDESAIVGRLLEGKNDEPVAECWEDEDAQFIASAPEDILRLLDEVERLQEKLEMWKATCGEMHRQKDDTYQRWLSVTQENDRLRKALEEIASHSDVSYQGEIARKALEGKTE